MPSNIAFMMTLLLLAVPALDALALDSAPRARQRKDADPPAANPGAGAGTLPSLDVTGRVAPPVGCPGPDCDAYYGNSGHGAVRGGYRRGAVPERITTVGDWEFLDVPEGASFWRGSHFMPRGFGPPGGARCRHLEPHFHGPHGVLILRVR